MLYSLCFISACIPVWSRKQIRCMTNIEKLSPSIATSLSKNFPAGPFFSQNFDSKKLPSLFECDTNAGLMFPQDAYDYFPSTVEKKGLQLRGVVFVRISKNQTAATSVRLCAQRRRSRLKTEQFSVLHFRRLSSTEDAAVAIFIPVWYFQKMISYLLYLHTPAGELCCKSGTA